MHQFISKYSSHLEEADCMRLMKKMICKAMEAQEEGEKDYCKHLQVLSEMIETYLAEKGYQKMYS